MPHPDFLKLDINARANIIWSDGELIGSREYYGYRIALYALKHLFVEVWYHTSTNKIEKIEPISNDEKAINHYLKDIDIGKLVDPYPYKSSNE
jgi:hypothetical protein